VPPPAKTGKEGEELQQLIIHPSADQEPVSGPTPARRAARRKAAERAREPKISVAQDSRSSLLKKFNKLANANATQGDAPIKKDDPQMMFNVLQKVLPEPERVSIEEAHRKLSPEEFKRVVKILWEKRQKEIEEAMAAVRDEAHYMTVLINELMSPNTTKQEQLNLLETMEFEVSDIDKARDFKTLGGMSAVLSKLIDGELEVRKSSAWVLGTMVKNFLEAQDWAVEGGTLPLLLQLLEFDAIAAAANATDLASEPELKLECQRKALYALGAVVRRHPEAKQAFRRSDGVSMLHKVLLSQEHSSSRSARLSLKVVAFLDDMLLEAADTAADSPDENQEEGSSGGSSGVWAADIGSEAWCALYFEIFSRTSAVGLQERVMQLMQRLGSTTAKPVCGGPTVDWGGQLQRVREEWTALSEDDMDSEYKAELLELVESVSSSLK
jgi:hypothetical protein